MQRSILFTAWRKLLLAYVLSFTISMATGSVLLNLIDVAPETIFEMSTKRLSYAAPVMEKAVSKGMNSGLVLFIWNAFGALATLSFIHTASLFNPDNIDRSPRGVRKAFCGSGRMRLLCYLPGCKDIEAEALRRLYVWLMVPLIGMILLGLETGFSASTAKRLFGSYNTGVVPLVLHGIIEIPAYAMAGAVPYSGHLLIKSDIFSQKHADIFGKLARYKDGLRIGRTAVLILAALFIAGMIEAHVSSMMLR